MFLPFTFVSSSMLLTSGDCDVIIAVLPKRGLDDILRRKIWTLLGEMRAQHTPSCTAS
jgi:hypothetical protein